MDSQKNIFLGSEGNQWYERNKSAFGSGAREEFSLKEILHTLSIQPKRILEIGCSNGFTLNDVQDVYQCEAFGIDPSTLAINEGKQLFSHLHLSVGTADELNHADHFFDVIVFGFCLYLCDRKDLFSIAKEADRCLQENGYMVIKDFAPPIPLKNKYSHREGLFSYKMNYQEMFTWNPAYNVIYSLISSHTGPALRGLPNEKVGITILHKNEKEAYVVEPYSH